MSAVPLALADLARLDIRTVVVATPDLQGRLVGRRVPAERFARVAERGIQICRCVWSWDVAQSDALIASDALPFCGHHNGIPDITLAPDLNTLRQAGWLSGVAVCMADPIDADTGLPSPISPRVLLAQELSRADALGWHPLVATELEFFLFLNEPRQLREGGFRDLAPTTVTSADFLIHEGDLYEPFFQKLRASLHRSGIQIETVQPEWGVGQWEMTLPYGRALEMADTHALFKLAVRDIAAQEGMSATFMAMPVNGQPGSSCHVHVSLADDTGAPLFWSADAPDHMSEMMRSALAGALTHTPDFLPWYAPTVNAWRRLSTSAPQLLSQSWDTDNRLVAARVVGHTPEEIRFEHRVPGADANPYLVLTGLIASMRWGIDTAASLGPARVSAPDAGTAASFLESISRFERSDAVRSVLSAGLVEHHATLWRHEWSLFEKTVSDWDLRRYFDRV